MFHLKFIVISYVFTTISTAVLKTTSADFKRKALHFDVYKEDVTEASGNAAKDDFICQIFKKR